MQQWFMAFMKTLTSSKLGFERRRARGASRTGERPSPWPVEQTPPLGAEGASPVQPAAPLPWSTRRCHTGWKRPEPLSCKATWKYYDCVAESFQSLWQAEAGSARKPRPTGTEIENPPHPPVEEHAPTNELISDMNCGVYVHTASLHCSGLELRRNRPLHLHKRLSVPTEPALWDDSKKKPSYSPSWLIYLHLWPRAEGKV